MGIIKITTSGSFTRHQTKRFSAPRHGHARALADAILYLSTLLPEAIRLDHDLHEQGHAPDHPFGKALETKT